MWCAGDPAPSGESECINEGGTHVQSGHEIDCMLYRS